MLLSPSCSRPPTPSIVPVILGCVPSPRLTTPAHVADPTRARSSLTITSVGPVARQLSLDRSSQPITAGCVGSVTSTTISRLTLFPSWRVPPPTTTATVRDGSVASATYCADVICAAPFGILSRRSVSCCKLCGSTVARWPSSPTPGSTVPTTTTVGCDTPFKLNGPTSRSYVLNHGWPAVLGSTDFVVTGMVVTMSPP